MATILKLLRHWHPPLGYFLQGDCALCGLPRLPAYPVCAACHADLPWLAAEANLPVAADVTTLSAFAYAPPISSLLLNLKFGRELRMATALGEMAAAGILPQLPALPDAILPVPLHPTRLRERGFNQAAELARPLAKRLGIPLLLNSVERQRATQRQTELDATARQRNLQAAFRLRSPLPYRHIAVFDDVLTTGATVRTLADLLLAQGVQQVQVWTCARSKL